MYNFSVIISVHFAINPKFFEDSIRSVINQSLIPNEIVIIYDGPNCNLFKIITNKLKKKFLNIDFKEIENEFNLGPGISRNKGIVASKNEFIAIMDADDYSVKNRFELNSCFNRSKS